MGSSHLDPWEKDPFFRAAEEVQQSADRAGHVWRVIYLGTFSLGWESPAGQRPPLPRPEIRSLAVFTNKSPAFSEIVKSLGVSFDLSPRQKAVVECLRAPRAQNFLTVIPIEGLGQHMSALEYRTILKYRLMIPLFPVDEPCPVCRKVCLDSFGEHAVHCKELPGFKYRHDLVRDVLYDVLKRAGISSKKEAPVNFLTDPLEGRSTLRPADILVFGWAGGKHACVDLTGVSPLVGLKDNGFVAGQAALKAESSKVAKHEKACLENQHVFIPFAFDTFGFLAPEAEEFFTRVQRVVQKWLQLEEFERAVVLSYDKNSTDDMKDRHRDFISAMESQISRVESSWNDSSVSTGKPPRPWVRLDEGERRELALFLSGSTTPGDEQPAKTRSSDEQRGRRKNKLKEELVKSVPKQLDV
ncbi:hypothetical protein Tco_1170132 [Tanacetum coccineum]